MRHRDVALARLVMVDVSWSEWNPQTDTDKYIGLVKKFAPPSPETSTARPAYIHLCYEKEAPSVSVDPPGETAWVEQQVPYELPPWDDCSNPGGWFPQDNGNPGGWFRRDNGHQAISVLEKECPPAPRPGRLAIHDVPGWGKLFRTRIFMDAERYRAVTGYGGDASYWALIDMRFQQITEGLVLWHTSLSIWSSLPWSRHHCPPDIRDGISQEEAKVPLGVSAVDAGRLIRDFRLHSRHGFRNELMRDVQRNELRVFDRLYEPPSFLVAVRGPRAGGWPSGHGLQTWRDRHYSEPDILRKVADEVLWTQYYESLPCALLRGGIKAYRRFFAAEGKDRPRYLLIPDTEAFASDPGRWHKIQEEATAVDVGILTNLEAYAASQLRGIDSRMQTLENHLVIYQGAAEQAGTLWDALARLLPDARSSNWELARLVRSIPKGREGPRLGMVHRSIEMIHQTLLQGVADLDQLVRNIDGAQSQIDSTADEVADRFDRELYHTSLPAGGGPLRDSLRGGYIDRLGRRVREASSAAARVTDSYRTLLDTIGMAFDERRVREGDRLQRASVWLAAAFGLLGLSGVAQATLPISPTMTPLEVDFLQGILWSVTGIVVLALLVQLPNLPDVGRVATRRFEQPYREVREFLAEASTDHLDQFRRQQKSNVRSDTERTALWHGLDMQLCQDFIAAWETADRYQKEAAKERDPYGGKALRSRVEAWTLQTLLLTERPRDFSLYSLPYLTCLYRVLTAQKLKDWREIPELPNAKSAVGDAELLRTLQGAYDWFSREEDKLAEMTPQDAFDFLEKSKDFQDSLCGISRNQPHEPIPSPS
jgi:hypothetical protein